jgi:hypothetical protein
VYKAEFNVAILMTLPFLTATLRRRQKRHEAVVANISGATINIRHAINATANNDPKRRKDVVASGSSIIFASTF